MEGDVSNAGRADNPGAGSGSRNNGARPRAFTLAGAGDEAGTGDNASGGSSPLGQVGRSLGPVGSDSPTWELGGSRQGEPRANNRAFGRSGSRETGSGSSSGSSEGGEDGDEGDGRAGERQAQAVPSSLALSLELPDTWGKAPSPSRAPKPGGKGPEDKPKRKKLSKAARNAKVAIYAHVMTEMHKGLSLALGPDALITKEQAMDLAANYVLCEEVYGWKSIEHYIPAMALAASIVAVEGPIVKKVAIPAVMQKGGKGNGSGGSSRRDGPPPLVRPN